MRSGIVLAGGRSTRFGGGEKSLQLVGGKRMICRVIDALCGIVDELIISVRDEGQRDILYPFITGHTFVYDEVEGIGPLAGIFASLARAEGDYAAVPRHDNGLIEPLHAVYRRDRMLVAVRESIEASESKISAPLKRLKDVIYVPVDEIRKVDPELDTFLNVNRAEDVEQIKRKNE